MVPSAGDHAARAMGPADLDLKQSWASARSPLRSPLGGAQRSAGLGTGLRVSVPETQQTARAGADRAEQGTGSWRVVPVGGAGGTDY